MDPAAPHAAAAQARAELFGEGEVICWARRISLRTETPTVFDCVVVRCSARFADPCRRFRFPSESRWSILVPLLSRGAGLEASWRLLGIDSVALGRRLDWGWVSYRTTCGMVPNVMTSFSADAPGAGSAFANMSYFRLRRASSAKAGSDLDVTLAWWVREPAPAEGDTHFTVQVLSAEGNLIAQDDHAGFPSSTWEAGDLVLASFEIPLDGAIEPGMYQVRAGMYSYPDVQFVPVVDVTGRPVDDGVLLTQVIITN